MRYIAIIVACLTLCACNKKHKNDDNPTIGKYVYVDGGKRLHTKRICASDVTLKQDGVEVESGINFIHRDSLNNSHFVSYCPWCVNDQHFEEIKNIIVENMGELYRIK